MKRAVPTDSKLLNGSVTRGGDLMLYWAIAFLIIALIAGALGFGGIAGTAATIAKILFVVFLVLFLVSLISGWRRPSI